jgi:hypothetical protein
LNAHDEEVAEVIKGNENVSSGYGSFNIPFQYC